MCAIKLDTLAKKDKPLERTNMGHWEKEIK